MATLRRGVAGEWGYSDAIFVFAMSAEWFDNGPIVRHLANGETPAKGSQPYGKGGSGFGHRGSTEEDGVGLVSGVSFPCFTKTMPWSFSTNQPDFWLCRLRASVLRRLCLCCRETPTAETTGLGRASHRSFCLRGSAVCEDPSGSKCAGAQFLVRTPVRRYLAVLRGRLGVEAGTLVHYFRRGGNV